MSVSAPFRDVNCLADRAMCLRFRHLLLVVTHSRLMDEKRCTSTGLNQIFARLGVTRVAAHRSGEVANRRPEYLHYTPALLVANYNTVTSDASVIDAGCLQLGQAKDLLDFQQ